MKFSPVIQFVAGIPDAGALVVTECREHRAEILQAIHQLCPPGSLDRVVVVAVSPEEMAALKRNPTAPTLLFPPPLRGR